MSTFSRRKIRDAAVGRSHTHTVLQCDGTMSYRLMVRNRFVPSRSPMTPADVAAARPRVEGEREQEILEATLDVLADVGYDRLTMDAVASAARASKATLYRRWETKASLVLEAVLAQKGPIGEAPDTGTLRGDLIASYCGHGGLADERADRGVQQRHHRTGSRCRVRRGFPHAVHRPQDRAARECSSNAPSSAARSATTSISTSSALRSPASSCTASSSSASRPPSRIHHQGHRPGDPPRSSPPPTPPRTLS